jgi:hypothetical protein
MSLPFWLKTSLDHGRSENRGRPHSATNEEPFDVFGSFVRVSVSMGVAMLPGPWNTTASSCWFAMRILP